MEQNRSVIDEMGALWLAIPWDPVSPDRVMEFTTFRRFDPSSQC